MRKLLLTFGIVLLSILNIQSQPFVNSISPNNGNQGQTLSVTINGTNINYGSQLSGTLSYFRFSQWNGSNMFFGNPTSTSGNDLYGNVSIPTNQNMGWYDLEVYDNTVGLWIILPNAFEVNGVSAINKLNSSNKELLKVVDILGREVNEKRNTPLFYIYNDGTVEKKIIIE